MQANRKKIGFFIIFLGLLIIAAIIYFVFNSNKQTVNNTEPVNVENNTEKTFDPGIGTTTPSDAPRNYQKYDISKEPAHKVTADDLGKISMSFAEKFGSYSNQANYSNFTDLKILMTKNMADWIDEYVGYLKKDSKNTNIYYGFSTQALTYKVDSFDSDNGSALISVTTQRRESIDKINGGEAYNQDLTLTLKKVGDQWLFDRAAWSK